MKRSLGICLALGLGLATGVVACKKEGPGEKVGRKFDDAIDKLQHGDEGAIEKAGRKIDEAVDEAADKVNGE